MKSTYEADLIFLRCENFLHLVEGRSGLEPLDLLLVEGVVQADVLGGTVAVLDRGNDGLKIYWKNPF